MLANSHGGCTLNFSPVNSYGRCTNLPLIYQYSRGVMELGPSFHRRSAIHARGNNASRADLELSGKQSRIFRVGTATVAPDDPISFGFSSNSSAWLAMNGLSPVTANALMRSL